MRNLFARTKKKLTFDETQEVITPFAFSIDESLFGTAIASPYKRGIAMAVDFLLIGMLSKAGGEFLAIALAIMAFRLGSQRRATKQGKEQGRKRRGFMRLIGALLLLVVLLNTLPPLFNNLFGDASKSQEHQYSKNDEDEGTEVDFATALKVTGYVINVIKRADENNCQQIDCWQETFNDVPEQVLELKLPKKQAKDLFAEVAESTDLPSTEQRQLTDYLYGSYLELYKQQNTPEKKDDSAKPVIGPKTDSNLNEQTQGQVLPVNEPHDSSIPSEAINETNKPSRPIYSIIELFKGIIDDLGLGFGWAALYFTVFTSWWQGKTPGKRLMNIRVLQLDGTPLSLWDSFGRYGGYGAGFATGLLGFLQIYWDPNRQAIQDKISATVVIDEKKHVAEEVVLAAKAIAIKKQKQLLQKKEAKEHQQ